MYIINNLAPRFSYLSSSGRDTLICPIEERERTRFIEETSRLKERDERRGKDQRSTCPSGDTSLLILPTEDGATRSERVG